MLITTEFIYGSAFSDAPIRLEGLKAVECSKGGLTYPVFVYQDYQIRDTKTFESTDVKKIVPLLQQIIKNNPCSKEKKYNWEEVHAYYAKDLRTVVEKAVSKFSMSLLHDWWKGTDLPWLYGN